MRTAVVDLGAGGGVGVQALLDALAAVALPAVHCATDQTLPADVASVLLIGDPTRSRPALSPALHEAVVARAQNGCPILGVGAGFAWLCDAGLLPGQIAAAQSPAPGPVQALARASTLASPCVPIFARVEGRPTPFTAAIPASRVLRFPDQASVGRYAGDVPVLEQDACVVLRYSDEHGGVGPAANPDGSLANIAAVCNAAGNVVGTLLRLDHAVLDRSQPGGAAAQMFFALRMWLSRPAR